MRRSLGLIVVLALLVGLGACGSKTLDQTTATTPPSPTTRIATPTTAASTTTVPRPSAYDQIAGFAGAASRMDLQLRHAAELINGSGPPWAFPQPAQVVSSVEAADLRAVAETIPNGLPGDLLRRAILVYSDLASRRYAMRFFGSESFPWVAPAAEMQSQLKAALANGAPAAARFAADLDDLIVAARASEPFVPATPASREAANLLLLLQWTDGMNGGCESTGGAIMTTLPAIAWTRGDQGGTIGAVVFDATLTSGAWKVLIHAC